MKPAESYRLSIASRYWKAAHLILTNQSRPVEFMEPIGHLFGMAAEITLKSYLSGRGYDDRKLKDKIGHDLEKCIWHAIREGAKVDLLDVECVLAMRKMHLNNFYRYGTSAYSDGNLKMGAFLMMDEEKTLVQIASLIEHISEYGARLSPNHPKLLPVNWKQAPPALEPVSLEQISSIKQSVKSREIEVENFNKQIQAARIK